jgi:DNA-binding response OmpR family regulator
MKMDGTDTGLKPQELLFNDLYIDPIGFQVKRGKTDIDLTVKEFELLYLFVQNK